MNCRRIFMLFIILFLHQTTTLWQRGQLLHELFIILFLHQTTTRFRSNRTVLRCLSSCSYIKPQPEPSLLHACWRCLSSCSYIKPQRNGRYPLCGSVVYHLVPTSNHNKAAIASILDKVVYHLVPTSNHNGRVRPPPYYALFIILFLHQTTTFPSSLVKMSSCLSSCSYIKPQRFVGNGLQCLCCLSSCSYIKPQRNKR